jgi:hypothetical protein
MNPETYETIIYLAMAGGLGAITYGGVLKVVDWFTQRRQYDEAHRAATQNYINGLLDQISSLQNDNRAYAARELEQLNQLEMAGKRIKFLGRELACDPDKKTQVLSR